MPGLLHDLLPLVENPGLDRAGLVYTAHADDLVPASAELLRVDGELLFALVENLVVACAHEEDLLVAAAERLEPPTPAAEQLASAPAAEAIAFGAAATMVSTEPSANLLELVDDAGDLLDDEPAVAALELLQEPSV